MASLVAQLVKKKKFHLQFRRPWFDSWVGKIPREGIGYPLQYSWPSPVVQMVKKLPAMQETWVRSLYWEDPPGGQHSNPLHYSCLENLMD